MWLPIRGGQVFVGVRCMASEDLQSSFDVQFPCVPSHAEAPSAAAGPALPAGHCQTYHERKRGYHYVCCTFMQMCRQMWWVCGLVLTSRPQECPGTFNSSRSNLETAADWTKIEGKTA